MIDTLTVPYEGINKVKATKENILNRKYEHFFAYMNESLTQKFNHFN